MIIDDSSTDNTPQIAQRSGYEYVRVENRSLYLTRKSSLKYITGDYIVFLDADDRLAPQYLEKCVEALSKDSKAAICTTIGQEFGDSDKVLFMPKDNINRANILHTASMVMKKALIESNAYASNYVAHYVAEDWYIWRRVINFGYTAIKVEEPLFYYRKHSKNKSKEMVENSYYQLACLEQEKVTRFNEGTGEYVLYSGRGDVPDNEIQNALQKFWINTAGVCGNGFMIIRRSVIKEFPTKDPTSQEWRFRTNKAGFVWVGGTPAPVQHEDHITAVIMTPLLTVGGAENWIRMIITLSDPTKITWKVVLFDENAKHPSVFGPIAARAEMFIVGRNSKYSSIREAITAAAIDSDIVVAWGGTQFWPLHLPIPVVMVGHGSCEYTTYLMKTAMGQGATHFACVSEFSKKLTTTPEMKATVIWNGADESRLTITKTPKEIRTSVWKVPEDWWFNDKIYIGYIGRLAQEKNPLSLVDAVAELPWQFQCVWVGPGLMKDAMVARASETLKERFYYVDFADDVGNHYNALDVTVATSHKEGNSLALIEAMLIGTPIVTTRVGAVDEFEQAAGCPLFYSLPSFPTSSEIAVSIREAATAGRKAPRVIAAQKFARNYLTGKTMADNWTKYLTGVVNSVPPLY